MKVERRTGDMVSGVLWLLFALWYLSDEIREGLPFYTPGGQPGAGFLPTLLAGGLFLLSVLLILRGWLSTPEGGPRLTIQREVVLKPAVVLVSLAVWIYFFQILGYVISTWLLTGGLMFTFAPARSMTRRIVMAVGISGLAVVGFYIIFAVIFVLELPRSPFLGI